MAVALAKEMEQRGAAFLSAEIKNITQIGIVTGDLYAMVDRYQKLYGIGPWEIRDGKKKDFKDEAEDLMVYGKRQDFKVSLALCMAGNVQHGADSAAG